MAPSEDEVKRDLKDIYDPMLGMSFIGEFLETVDMPTTGKKRDKISVTDIDDAMEGNIAKICQKVSLKYDSDVWKGITGPNDNPDYKNYWLWVVCTPGLIRDMYNFRVREIEPFVIEKPLSHF